MLPDLHATRQALAQGRTSALEQAQMAVEAARSPACAQAFVHPMFEAARSAARLADQAGAAPQRPLAGLAVSVKDLFDVAGQTTRAGSALLAMAPPALADCPAVARLRAAGAALIGRTQMVEFAFSGVGLNPHHGTPAAWDGLHGRPVGEPGQPCIPGGSSSGAAVSVASGAAFVGLGTDTGGSLRIPAAFNGLVGFKSTARLVPTEGVLPLSPSLDTVGALTRSVRDAVSVHEVLAARRVTRSPAPLSSYRLAVAHSRMLDELDAPVAQAFERSLDWLRAAGARIDDIRLDPLLDTTALQAQNGLAVAESHAWHREHLARAAERYDPRVASRILRGAPMLAHEYIDLQHTRQRWIARMERALSGYDAVLSPTVPLVPCPLAGLAPADGLDPAANAARDAAYFRINALLLRNTSVVNLLDGCALSLPCHRPGEWPVGLMLWHGALHDDALLNLAGVVEQALHPQLLGEPACA